MRPAAGHKPLDIGTGLVCASLAGDGSWLSFGAPHQRRGFVELSAMPTFDEAARGVPALVRRYRALMADPAHAFLVLAPDPAEPVSRTAAYAGTGRLRHVRRSGGWSMTAETTAVPGSRSLVQALSLRRMAKAAGPTAWRVSFRGRLDRPALAEITEVSPPRPTGSRTHLAAIGARLLVGAPELPAEMAITLTSPAGALAWQVGDGDAELAIAWPSGDDVLELAIEIEMGAEATARRGISQGRLAPARERGRPSAVSSSSVSPSTVSTAAPDEPSVDPRREAAEPVRVVVPEALVGVLRRIRRRAVDYIRGCTCLHVADGRATILTDHRILPLSWTRDAYFQARLLLSEAVAAGDETLLTAVEDHLRWLWLSCDRPAATWARSHRANGGRKDEAYQADQQLYPLLELADFWRITGRLPDLGAAQAATAGWSGLVAAVLDRIAGGLSPDGLLPTDENAADDAARGQFLLANQILAWHTLNRLAGMSSVLPLSASLVGLAGRIRGAAMGLFEEGGPTGAAWAYALDGAGRRSLYHDANDLPTALAPMWGFCAANDRTWQATMRFAFSPANEGYVSGPWGGLGSRHTPGVWPLGLAQEWLGCSLMDDVAGATRAVERLVRLRFADGSLPEAADPDSGRALARHWFAWPGALVGALLDGAV